MGVKVKMGVRSSAAAVAPGFPSGAPPTGAPAGGAIENGWRRGLADRLARKTIQIGFLTLFLYPYFPLIYNRLADQPAPDLASWLLPWDPLLLVGHVLHRDWSFTVLGAPLLLLGLTAFLGRFFCGWICPLGTVLDVERSLVDGIRRVVAPNHTRSARRAGRLALFPGNANGPAKMVMLVLVLAGSFLSLQAMGALDPLVIFHRVATVIASDILASQRPLLRMYLSASVVFILIVGLEIWQPRFWCRHLCPLGALLNLASRRSLVNRRVSSSCNSCGDCRRICPMRAIPREAHDTNYGDCHLCLNCESICPRGAISFGAGALAGKKWRGEGRVKGPDGRSVVRGRYVAQPAGGLSQRLSRRTMLIGVAGGAAGLALPVAVRAAPAAPVIRPPGALREADFLRTCILCQECVRVCPSSALAPVAWRSGLAAVGTPRLEARQGACLLPTSCPNLCAQVCPTGAILPIPKEKMRIALAFVDRTTCLAWDQGRKCLVCVEACPTGAAQPFYGRVTVNPEKCWGCGRCEQACPVAGAAIHVAPIAT